MSLPTIVTFPLQRTADAAEVSSYLLSRYASLVRTVAAPGAPRTVPAPPQPAPAPAEHAEAVAPAPRPPAGTRSRVPSPKNARAARARRAAEHS